MWCHVRAETACFSSVAKRFVSLFEEQPLVFIQQHYHHKAMWPVLCYCSHTLRPEGQLITTIEDINFMVKCLLAFHWRNVSQGIRETPFLKVQ